MADTDILTINELSLQFPIYKGAVKALNGVTLRVAPREIVGVVGESGSGKSVTSMLAMRLLVEGSYRVTGGSVTMLGQDILRASERTMLGLRGSRVAMIFQEPMTALNPTKKVGDQMTEVIRLHRRLSLARARAEAVGLLQDMHVADPEQILKVYPFELSGGMRQRVLLALAFSCEPELLIADEPTTALDVTVQRQVLLLLREKARQKDTAILFITHDMAVVSQFCDRVYVMYAGGVVESGPTGEVMGDPRHPYTRGLLQALPDRVGSRGQIQAIPGTVPDLTRLPEGCPFASRCPLARPACARRPPTEAVDAAGIHCAACWALHEEERAS
jgi:peptide/nickel transport system ATP-binding protein